MCVLGLSVMCIFFGGCVFQNEYFCVYVFRIWGFPGGSLGKNLPASAGRGRWKIPWRRKWQPTSVFLPGKSHGQRSLAGCSPWGRK